MNSFETFQHELKNTFVPQVRELLASHHVPVVVYHASNETIDQAHVGHLATINLPADATTDVQTNLPGEIQSKLNDMLVGIIKPIRETSKEPEKEVFTIGFVVTPALIKFEGSYNRQHYLYNLPIAPPEPAEVPPGHDPEAAANAQLIEIATEKAKIAADAADAAAAAASSNTPEA